MSEAIATLAIYVAIAVWAVVVAGGIWSIKRMLRGESAQRECEWDYTAERSSAWQYAKAPFAVYAVTDTGDVVKT